MTRAIKRTIVYLAGAALVVVVIDLSGVFRHPFEKDYFTEFSYPLDIPNFASVVRRYGNKEPTAYDPINYRYANLTYLKTADSDCNEEFRLIILVKSAPNNFRRRQAIRSTWGYRKRFSDVPIKTVFLLGIVDEKENNAVTPDYKSKIKDYITLNESINEESDKYGDIVQADFIDSYYNNTYKTLMGMRWLVETCKLYRFAFFSDDDVFISVKNLLKFLRHPTSYPEYWENQKKIDKFIAEQHYSEVAKKYKQNRNLRHGMKVSAKKGSHIKSLQHDNAVVDDKTGKVKIWKNNPIDFDIDMELESPFFSGYVYFLPPYRHKLGSKWYLSLDEYPYSYLPPFVPAGAMAFSRTTVFDIYYASLFTKHLRFDDVFIAICAKKLGNIEPYHSEYFRLKPSYPVMDRDDIKLEYLIAWHGFDDPDTLVRFWSAQKSLGNA